MCTIELQIFGGFCRSSALRGKFARVLLTPHPENPDTEVTFDHFLSQSDIDNGALNCECKNAQNQTQVHLQMDEFEREMHKEQVQMLKCSNVRSLEYSNAHMLKCPIIRIRKCENTSNARVQQH